MKKSFFYVKPFAEIVETNVQSVLCQSVGNAGSLPVDEWSQDIIN